MHESGCGNESLYQVQIDQIGKGNLARNAVGGQAHLFQHIEQYSNMRLDVMAILPNFGLKTGKHGTHTLPEGSSLLLYGTFEQDMSRTYFCNM